MNTSIVSQLSESATQTSSTLVQEWGDNHWDGPGWGGFPLFPFLWLFVVIAVVTIVALSRRRDRDLASTTALDETFARGEITEDEYRSRLAVIRSERRGFWRR